MHAKIAPPGADQREGTVYLVEDHRSSRDSTARFLRASGYAVRTYGTAMEFLDDASARVPGCLVLDLRLPGLSGFDLQQALASSDDPPPIIFLTGQAEVPDSVRAMKSGAVDFLMKSDDGTALLEAVSRALARDAEERTLRHRRREIKRRYDRLTPRERDVFAHLISGQLNKQVGFDLGIREPTIKIHRHRVLLKMEANSIADLVRMASDLGIVAAGTIS